MFDDPKQDPVVSTFAKELKQRLGYHLKQLLLFGSRARNDAHKDSDYDMLVVVDERNPEIRSIILEVEVSIMDRYEALVASVVRDEGEWLRSQDFPLARNISREGLKL